MTVSAVAADTFAANRARGRIALSVAAAKERTRRMRVQEEGSLRVRFPNTAMHELDAVIVNTAGGVAGGDQFDIEIDVGAQAQLCVSGAAAEKVYRAIGADTRMALNLSVGEGGALRWLPQETILFDRARLARSIEIDFAADASLVVAEAIVFGRTAMGESVRDGRVMDRWRVRREGRLVLAETLALDGAIAQTLALPAMTKGGVAIATILIAPVDDATIARLRAPDYVAEVGISGWNGFALARLCAPDGARLRHDLVALLAALDRGAVPRLWLN